MESTDRKESDLWGERGRCGAALKSSESVSVCVCVFQSKIPKAEKREL